MDTGDTCCSPGSMGRIMRLIEDEYPGIYIHSLQIGDNFIEVSVLEVALGTAWGADLLGILLHVDCRANLHERMRSLMQGPWSFLTLFSTSFWCVLQPEAFHLTPKSRKARVASSFEGRSVSYRTDTCVYTCKLFVVSQDVLRASPRAGVLVFSAGHAARVLLQHERGD